MATKPRAKMVQRDATLDDLLKSGTRYQQFAEEHPEQAAPAEPSSLTRRVLGDGGIALMKGAIGVPEAAVGLADLATGGAAGKMLENEGGAIGFRPKMAQQFLDTYKSPEQQAADKSVGEAQGFVDTTVAALKNPSVVLGSVAESVPMMLGGGVIARSLLRMAPAGMAGAAAAPVVAGAAGEGIVAAGSSAEAIRQETPDGLLTGEQASLAAASGLATGFLGYLGGKVAQRLGINDIDTVLAGKAGPEVTKGFTRRVLEGAVSEGLLEELPQSVQEQVAQNMALGRPLGEGVPQAAVLGALAGGLMGGGGNAISYGGQVRREKVDGTGPASKAINAGLEDTAQQADAIQAGAVNQGAPVNPGAPVNLDAPPAAAAPTEPVAMGAPIEPAAMPPEQPSAEPAVPRPITEGRKINLDGKDWIVTTRPQGGYSITNGAETRSVPAAAKTGKRIAELLAGGPAAPAVAPVAPAAPMPTAAPAPVSDSQAFAEAEIPLPDETAPPAPIDAAMADPVEPSPSDRRANDEPAPTPPAADGAEWQTFEPETGTKSVPRAEMPQIRAEHRGAMVQFLKGRGILHEQETEVDAAGLKPTQAEFSMAKVQKAREFTGGNRAILVSNDGHVLDGHHQWLAAATDGKPLRVIRLDAPIDRLLAEVKEFPSATTDTASAPAAPETPPAAAVADPKGRAPYYVMEPGRTGKRIPVPSPEAAAAALGKFTARTGAEPVDGSMDVYDAQTGLPAFNVKPDGTVKKVESREEAEARSRRMIEDERRTVDAAPATPKLPAPAAEPIIEHVTGKGKTLRGVIRRMPEADAKALDPGTFKKNGGWFIRASRAGLGLERLTEIADTPTQAELANEAARPQAQAAGPEANPPAATPAAAPAAAGTRNASVEADGLKPEAWWEKNLTAAGRHKAMLAAGMAKGDKPTYPDTIRWQYLPLTAQARLRELQASGWDGDKVGEPGNAPAAAPAPAAPEGAREKRERLIAEREAAAAPPAPAPEPVVTSSQQPLSDAEQTELDGMLGHSGAISFKDMGGHWRAEATGNSLRIPVRAHGSTKDASRRNLLAAVRQAREAEQSLPPAAPAPGAALLQELRTKLSALADRAQDVMQGKLSGQIRGFTIGMKDTDSNLTRAWVDEVVAERERMVLRAEKAAKPAPAPAPKPDKAEIRPFRRTDGSIGYEAVPIIPPAPEPKPADMAGFDVANDAEMALRKLAHADKRPGDVELGNGKFVTLEQATAAARASMTPEQWKMPFQFNRALDIASVDWNRMVQAMTGAEYRDPTKGNTTDSEREAKAKPERPAELIELRKRLSVLQSLKECLA